MTRAEKICARLRSALHADAVDLIDDSHLHAGHAGARDGRGHFRVRIVSPDFEGLRTVQRHQLVYRSLGDLMQTDIHALGIAALTPAEARTSD
ncbi:MAG TPA: BolA family protein [Povalibacter sp.]|uniref:BolA family protein n=1 Tax=Povalibacter sp. TaxID=1962978 RepID=UPI002C8850D8|nr:BolA family protein [Povalibacter sp.]HMN45731.1 BolA family protein [Povalibacter sp.]